MQKLVDLETKIARSADSARRRNDMESWWQTSIAANYQKKWEALMDRLRGWSTVNAGKTSPQWMEYCDQAGLAYNYNFGDVVA